MKKRIFAALITASMLALTACGGAPAGGGDTTGGNETPATTAPVTPNEETPAGGETEAPTGASTGEVRNYTLADNHKDGYPTVLGDQKFAELVKERTGGSILIDVVNNAQLGDEKTTVEQTQMGDIHFNRVGTNVLSPINDKFNALTMPYLYRDTEHMFKVLDSDIGDEFLELAKEDGLIGLAWFDPGTRNFYNSKKEIKTPADMAGLKIRVQETKLMMDLISYLGASPTPMPLDDVYSGIQNGVIDGAENNWPSYMSTSHNEVATFITIDAHTRAPELILVNTDVWESFSAEEQEIVKAAAEEAALFQREEWTRQENEYMQQALDAGSTITELTPDEFQQFVDAVQPIYEDPEYAQYADVYERIRAIA